MNPARILVAGIGNIFFGDDAFGVEVIAALRRSGLPESVRVVDFGIRAYDLAYAFGDGYEVVVFVDATPRGTDPGTIFLIEPEWPDAAELADAVPVGHGLDPVGVLRLAATLVAERPRIFLVGCEPATLASEDGAIELSPAVRSAVPAAVAMIGNLVGQLLAEAAITTAPASAGRPARRELI